MPLHTNVRAARALPVALLAASCLFTACDSATQSTQSDGAPYQRAGSAPAGIGTASVQRRILDRLGTRPSIAFHVLADSTKASPDPLVLRDLAAGHDVRLRRDPAWTFRDVTSIRLDPQADSTVLVVLLLRESPATMRYFTAARRGVVEGALLVNGAVWEVGSTQLFGTGDVPVAIGPFPEPEASRLAAILRAAIGSPAPL